jgi:uncharacterized protein (DUF2461 family)
MDVKNLLQFLSELKNNNNREWFAENKAWYDSLKKDFEKQSTQVNKNLMSKL